MFGRDPVSRDDSRHLLGQDHIGDDEIWEQSSDRNTATSEVWEQDPLHTAGEAHELRQIMTPVSRATSTLRSMNEKVAAKDHGVAASDLEAEFSRIYSPVRETRCIRIQSW
jgi:hypothetical protein